MRTEIPCILCLVICCVLLAGCTDQSSPKPVETYAPTVTPVHTAEPPASLTIPQTTEPTKGPSLFDQPISEPPADIFVSVSVRKDPIYSTITAIFDGGKGQDLVQSIVVRTTLSTGEVTENQLDKQKGAELTINGSRGADRIQVAVTYMNGNSYHISDTILDPNRAETPTITPVEEKTASINEEALYPGPVTIPPNNLIVTVDVQKEPIYRVITGTFRGGHGQSLVSRIDMIAVLGTGESVTRQIANNIGALAEIQGTDKVDRVQIVVSYKNGETYKIVEKAFGSRG